ncbi:hypothetical protein TA3x_004335 [Tundrisphaera sp. TA3]|uniref:hypothetical protein n=1 Tax=Tundrisphaera sp. TA3 TaxID=3435775 RepID=UPI003EB6D5A1
MTGASGSGDPRFAEPPPAPEPWAAEYAAWRTRALCWTCAAAAASYALSFAGGAEPASVRFGLRDPAPSVVMLEAGLNWYLRGVTAAFVLSLVAATWLGPRLRWSCLLARLAWALGFFGMMPLFLIPFPRVLHQHGVEAVLLATNVIRGILGFYVPSLFSLLPALSRAARVLKRVLPESTLPGLLVVVASPLQSLVTFVLLAILVQVVPHRGLILGVLCLSIAPLVWLPRAGALVRPCGRDEAVRRLRGVGAIARGFALLGVGLILREAWGELDLDWLLGEDVDLWYALNFLLGVLANRTLLSVVLVDGLLSLLFHAERVEAECYDHESIDRLHRKIRAIGAALVDTRGESDAPR